MKSVIVLLVVCVTAGIASANLLSNGNFNSPASSAAPDNWSTWAWGSGWSNHQNDASSFDSSYYMAVGGMNWGQGGGGVFQTVPGITAGTNYTLTVEAGAQAWWKPVGYMTMMWLDPSGAQISQSQLKIIDPANYDTGVPWTNFSLTAAAPTGATQVKVEFANYDGQGSVWYDNAVLTPEPATLAILGLGGLLLRRK